jgi:hypothetical protein
MLAQQGQFRLHSSMGLTVTKWLILGKVMRGLKAVSMHHPQPSPPSRAAWTADRADCCGPYAPGTFLDKFSFSRAGGVTG